MGASLPKPVMSTVVERTGSKQFRVGLAEVNGWRSSMEDAHICLPLVPLGRGAGAAAGAELAGVPEDAALLQAAAAADHLGIGKERNR